MRFRRCDRPFEGNVVPMNVGSVTNLAISLSLNLRPTECPNRTAETKTARSVRRVSDFVLVGDTESDILARRASARNVPILPAHLGVCEALVR